MTLHEHLLSASEKATVVVMFYFMSVHFNNKNYILTYPQDYEQSV